MSHETLSEVDQLAREIADSCARSDIECGCTWEFDEANQRWYNTADIADADGADDVEEVKLSLRYLELRGLLIRSEDDPSLVRFKEAA